MADESQNVSADEFRKLTFMAAAERASIIVAQFDKPTAIIMLEEIVRAIALTLGELAGHAHAEQILRLQMLRQYELGENEKRPQPYHTRPASADILQIRDFKRSGT